MTRNIQYWMITDDYNFIQKAMSRNTQQWMIMIMHKFNPGTDDKKHPIMEDNLQIKFWMIKSSQISHVMKYSSTFG